MQTSSEIERKLYKDSVGRIEIAPLDSYHALKAACLHIDGQPGTFLTSLGPDVLTVVYRALPQVQSGFGFVVLAQTPEQKTEQENDAILGFVSATSSVGRLFAEVGRQEFSAFAPLLAARFIRHPALLWRAMQTIFYPFLAHRSLSHEQSAPSESHTIESGKTIELLSIMVEPEARGRGIGGHLLNTLVDKSVGDGATALDVTVAVENVGAQRFYARHGFTQLRQFRLYGKQMALYRKRLRAEG